jgi:hypothetical protein
LEAERIPVGESLILKEGWVFDEGCFRLLYDGHKSAIIAMVTVGKYRHRLGLYYG